MNCKILTNVSKYFIKSDNFHLPRMTSNVGSECEYQDCLRD